MFQNSLAGLNKTLYSTREKLIHPTCVSFHTRLRLVCKSDTRVGESFSFSTRTVIYYYLIMSHHYINVYNGYDELDFSHSNLGHDTLV
jgi:hypothetical protein